MSEDDNKDVRWLCERIADVRRETHRRPDGSYSPTLSAGSEERGIAGEVAFARRYGLPVDMESRKGGDGGVDFSIPLLFTIDVKTFEKPYHLLVEQGKVNADIYVLAFGTPDVFSGKLIKWAWRDDVRGAPVRDVGGFGVLSHYIHRDDERMRPISELDQRLAVIAVRPPKE